MDFYVDGKYSSFKELMHYYHWDFYVYYILVIIVFVNFIKAIIGFFSAKKGKTSHIVSGYTDIFISILAGLGLVFGMFFQGVLSDISSEYSVIWGKKMLILSIVAFILFIFQAIFTLKVNIVEKQERG